MLTIYRYNSFKKELRFDFHDQKTGQFRVPILGLFAALMALAIHYMLQMMQETVLPEVLPEYMARSNFSLLFTYNNVYLIAFMGHMILNYRTRTFAEMVKNQFYLQAKMGYKPTTLVLSKMGARLTTAIVSYSLGYLLALLIGFFLKYYFIQNYIITMYITGLVDSIVVLFMILTVSLFIQDSRNNFWFVLLIGTAHQFSRNMSGHYALTTKPAYMRSFEQFFDMRVSPYLLYQAAVFLVCILFLLFGASFSAQRYHYTREAVDRMPKSYTVGRIQRDPKLQKKAKEGTLLGITDFDGSETPVYIMKNPRDRAELTSKIINGVLMTVASALILLMLAFNIFILVLSGSQKTTEVSIRGTIPYLFHSDTMSPAIAKNDLVYFRQIDTQSTLEVGDIVIFRDNYEVFIERITEVDGNQVTVDIDNYPEMSQEDAMVKTVARDAIYGRYYGRNRWLGALIHFANTIVGRILFLLVPAILLFYHDKILKLLERFYNPEIDEELILSQRALHEKRQMDRLTELGPSEGYADDRD